MVQRNLYMKRVEKLLDTEPVKIITGVRRCGKSYMLHLIMKKLTEKGINNDNIIYINFDTFSYLKIKNYEQLDDLITDTATSLDGKIYFFFDEIQNVSQWEKSVNACKLEYDCDIFITGSNSKLLSNEISTYLTGRYITIEMYPFSFKEYVDYYNTKHPKEVPDNEELFNIYLNYGGLPGLYEISESERVNYLKNMMDSVFIEDVVNRYNIRDSGILYDLAVYLMNNTGNIFSVKSLKGFLNREKINYSENTLNTYINYLVNAFFIYKINTADTKGRKIFKRIAKYYIVDHAFLNVTDNNDIGRILENIVCVELLRRGYSVKVGRAGDYEIDFVCTRNKDKIYVQVAYLLAGNDVIEREFRPLLEVKDNYPKFVLSMDRFDFSRDGIQHMNIIDFLLDNS